MLLRAFFLFLFLSFPLCAGEAHVADFPLGEKTAILVPEKKKVCLNMIVKNESHVITRCLESVKPFIDYWVIVDTGSTDGTQQVIKNFMKGIPGELFERPWKNFEHNRNEALDLARSKANYVLIMDADDFLKAPPGYKLPELTAGSYQMEIHYGGMTYARHQLIKMSLPWKWQGVVHEVLTCDVPYTSVILDNVQYVVTQDGDRSKDPKKYYKDAALLEEALKKDPTSTRYTFYLAQSYKNAGEKEKSLEWYQKRIAMGGWDEEVFWSMIEVALLQKQLHRPTDDVMATFERAHRYRPHRVEPVYYLAELYNEQGKHDLAYALIKTREYIKRPPSKDVLFTQDWMEHFGLLFQLSISSYYVGNYQESLDACDALLAMDDFPWKDLVKENKKFPVARLQKMASEKAA